MTLNLRNSTAWSFVTTLSSNTKELLDWIKERSYPLTIEVSPVPACFYHNRDDSSEIKGPVGYEGPQDPTKVRPSLPLDQQVVSISGYATKDDYTLSPNFKVGKGVKDTLTPLTFTVIPNLDFVNYGWYKRPGFDAAYQALKVLKPDLTELGFCFNHSEESDGFDTDLLEHKPYQGGEGCVNTDKVLISNGIKYYSFRISSLDSDLSYNLPLIKEFLCQVAPTLTTKRD